VQRKVRAINQEAARCQRVVQNLLSFARHHHPEKGPVDLNGVVRSVMQLLEYQLRVEGVDVDLDLSRDLPPVRADRHQLQQVVLNLVNNAHHAMQDAPRRGRLSVVSRVRGGRVVLTIEDNGVGIPRDQLRRVFDPFFTTKEVGRGTGLGLSLAYGCISEHGGEIRAESRPGEWTRFIVELPGLPGRAATARAAAQHAASPRRVPAGRDVLVVDDEPNIALVIAEALTADGHRVEVVHNGRDARESIDRRRFDLVITDLKMPEMSGRELYENLLRHAPEMATRVIFSTGDTVSQETLEFLRSTGGRYLTKPFKLADLHAAVDEALRIT
jgi:two-component system NtrC family sensor kinase